MGHLWLCVGIVCDVMGGAVMVIKVTVFGYAQKMQGGNLSGHCMTTSFSPFELLTHGLLQKGQNNFPLPRSPLLPDAK